MYIEYCLYDRTLNEKEILKEIEDALNAGVSDFCLLPYSLSSIKNSGLLKKDIRIAIPLDFPFGVMDLDSRKSNISNIIDKYNINSIDIVAPSKILSNNKYSKLREDIDNIKEIIAEKSIDIRYILEYRLFNHHVLARCCQILTDKGIKTIIPSTGNMIDDINDNIIACKYLESKSKIKTICSGKIYSEKHRDIVLNSEINRIRVFNMHSIHLLNNL